MNLMAIFSERIGKEQVNELAAKISGSKKLFDELMRLAMSAHPEISMRASWTAIHTSAKNAAYLQPWLEKILKYIRHSKNTSVKRNMLKILEDVDIPEKYQAEMFDTGIKILTSSEEAVATKAFSMTVLANIIKKVPGLKREFILILTELMKNDKRPAFQSRGKNIMKELSSI